MGQAKQIVIVEKPDRGKVPSVTAFTADEYLEGQEGTLESNVLVVNLCRSYEYLTKGYYVSLLGDARSQQVYPSLDMLEGISNPFAYFQALRANGVSTIDYTVIRGRRRLLPKVIVPTPGMGLEQERNQSPLVIPTGTEPRARYEHANAGYVEVVSIFGKTLDERFRRHCAAIFRAYAFPLLRVRMYLEEDGWKVGQIAPVPISQLPGEELAILTEKLAAAAWETKEPRSTVLMPQRIACLWDEDDPLQPSDEKTLRRFERAAARQGALLETIGRSDLQRLSQYDALFIRTVTAIDHYSFRFAQTAASLGMPVIDDPQSTMKCSNKVYLHELFSRNGIPTPRTLAVSRKTPVEEIRLVGLPCIVKVPDGSFSQAVKKAEDEAELSGLLQQMFKESPLLIVQEYAPTSFDWRIGILEGRILFACKYHMARRHWQVVRRSESGLTRFGKVEAVSTEEVPAQVRQVALEAASLIGNGLYGVDIKETNGGVVVIEINDNPNIEAGYEDVLEGDRVYDEIVGFFLRRIHQGAIVEKYL